MAVRRALGVAALVLCFFYTTGSASAVDAQLRLGERFSGFAVAGNGVPWASTANLGDRVQIGPLTASGLALHNYTVSPEQIAFGTILPREDGGLWYVESTDMVASISATGGVTDFGPLSGSIESAVVNLGGSLSVAVGHETVTTISISGTITSSVLNLPAGACEPFQQLFELDRGPGPDTWVIESFTCAHSLLKDASGNITAIATAPPAVPPLDVIYGSGTAPDGSLWLLGTSNHQWSLRHITVAGVATSFALPPPPRSSLGLYNTLTIAPDGTPWIGVARSCSFYFLAAGVLHKTTAPLPESVPSFDPTAPRVWLSSATRLTHVSLSALERGGYHCAARIPRLRYIDGKTISIGTLERSGLPVAASEPSVMWGSMVLEDSTGELSARIGEVQASPRIIRRRGGRVAFRFAPRLLRTARARLREGRHIFISPGVTHANNEDGVSGYIEGVVSVTR